MSRHSKHDRYVTGVIRDLETGRDFTLGKDVNTIGKDDGCDVHIPPVGPLSSKIGRLHAEISRHGSIMLIRSLGKYKTYLNGFETGYNYMPLKGSNELRDFSKIELGGIGGQGYRLRFWYIDSKEKL
jgi:hypothetical protein